MEPYFRDDDVTLYLGDCREVVPGLPAPAVVVTDPPFGINYVSGYLARPMGGDGSTEVRDWIVDWCRESAIPALIFGTWKIPKPPETKALLIWRKGPVTGMGDLKMPWKPDTEEIYVFGSGFCGHRGSSVLNYNPPPPLHGRSHPCEKPLRLMGALLAKCPPGLILDPCMGSGATLVAAKKLGKKAIGIEIDERYCEVAAKRLQGREAMSL